MVGKYMDGNQVVVWDEEKLDMDFETTHQTWLPEDLRGSIHVLQNYSL